MRLRKNVHAVLHLTSFPTRCSVILLHFVSTIVLFLVVFPSHAQQGKRRERGNCKKGIKGNKQ